MSNTLVFNKKAYNEKFKKPHGPTWPVYCRLLRYGQPYLLIFIIAVLGNACHAGIDSLFIYLMKPLLDHGFVNPNLAFIRWMPLIAVSLFATRAIVMLVGNYCMGYVGRRVVFAMRQQIFHRLMRLPCSFYDKNSSGSLLSMIIYNVSQVAAACTDAITSLIQSVCMMIGLITVMFTINWRLALTFLLFVPIMAVTIKFSGQRLRRLNRNAQNSMGHVTHSAEEAIEGYKVIRMFGGEAFETARFEKAAGRNMLQELKIIITKSLSTSSIQFFGVCGLAGIIYFGTTQAIESHLTAGGFAGILSAMMALLKPLKDLTMVNATIQRGLAGAESVFELLDQPIEVDTGTYTVKRARGEIQLKNVSFTYPGYQRRILDKVSFTMAAGKTTALVGRSGCGKSTLANLLPRFYDCQAGCIYLDGIPVSDYQLANLRQQFALVSQQINLFNDSVRNNIAYGCVDGVVSDEIVLQAAMAAHAMEFIEKLPQGLDTIIGENGVLLSGGQRQRIAIARAILKDAPVLILDEATSALDTESERCIQQALEAVMQNRTTLVIAHRLSTIEKADDIIVLEAGRVLEQGRHADLLALDGHYASYHRSPHAEVLAASIPA